MPVSKKPEFRVGEYCYKGDKAYSEEELAKAKPALVGNNWKWTCPFCSYANVPPAYTCQRCGAIKVLFVKENKWYVLEGPAITPEPKTELARLRARLALFEEATEYLEENGLTFACAALFDKALGREFGGDKPLKDESVTEEGEKG